MESMELKRLPVSIQTFSEVIHLNCLYVDKTPYIHKTLYTHARFAVCSRDKKVVVTCVKPVFLS